MCLTPLLDNTGFLGNMEFPTTLMAETVLLVLKRPSVVFLSALRTNSFKHHIPQN